ncbi:alpha/beta hydrolase [Sphingomonas sp.]|uniref:alpha/beta hydrolase n=1 Tax=Sphingomonas sp. TaxID=28214 RepID=UPI0025FD4025|nr:alpha/beta hydrolase [Sphingomonas sp.]
MQVSRRQVMKGAGASALIAAGGLWAVGGWSQARDARFADVDPEMIDDLARVNEMIVSADNLAAFRVKPGSRPAHPLSFPAWTADALPPQSIPGLPGEPPVRVLVFDGGAGRQGRGALIWIHGGGYVSGAAGIGPGLRMLARERGLLIVSVDYRLAPEAKFPASLNDNYAALKWVHDNAARLGVDVAKIAVGGSSAGGGHAAMLAIAARDRREIPLAFQVLIYPMLDDRTGSSVPARPGTGQFIWTAAANRFGWTSLLGQPAGGANPPAGAVPARLADVRGLAPAFIGTGTLDLFYDEDVAYAGRLAAAGVPIDLAVVPGAFHAFDGIAAAARASRAFTERWMRDLATAIG